VTPCSPSAVYVYVSEESAACCLHIQAATLISGMSEQYDVLFLKTVYVKQWSLFSSDIVTHSCKMQIQAGDPQQVDVTAALALYTRGFGFETLPIICLWCLRSV
jgi:hypothetical protein